MGRLEARELWLTLYFAGEDLLHDSCHDCPNTDCGYCQYGPAMGRLSEVVALIRKRLQSEKETEMKWEVIVETNRGQRKLEVYSPNKIVAQLTAMAMLGGELRTGDDKGVMLVSISEPVMVETDGNE